jgi:cold shock CspA family protein
MHTLVKNWFRDKESGFLDNGGGPDIMVRKDDLIGCHFLKVSATVEFECHIEKKGLVAKKVKISRKKLNQKQNTDKQNPPKSPFGVMT